MYKYVCTFVKGMSTGRWIPSSANSFCSSSVIITDLVLTDNIIDQNHFGNIIRTSLSNSMKSFGPIWNEWFCSLKNQYQGYNYVKIRILREYQNAHGSNR